MRRSDRLMDEECSKELLQNGEYGVLSTVNQEHIPYGVPLSYVYYDNQIYFHSATEGHKITNLQTNNNVSFCVVGNTKVLPDTFSTNYESVIVFGTCEEIIEEQTKKDALYQLIKKYSPNFLESGINYIDKAFHKTKVWKINITHHSGKAKR